MRCMLLPLIKKENKGKVKKVAVVLVGQTLLWFPFKKKKTLVLF